MDKSQQKLIENFKKQLQDKYQERAIKQYIVAIEQVIKEKLNIKQKPLTFIPGSDKIADIDNIDMIVSKYTSYPE
jgi:hypothetical protein